MSEHHSDEESKTVSLVPLNTSATSPAPTTALTATLTQALAHSASLRSVSGRQTQSATFAAALDEAFTALNASEEGGERISVTISERGIVLPQTTPPPPTSSTTTSTTTNSRGNDAQVGEQNSIVPFNRIVSSQVVRRESSSSKGNRTVALVVLEHSPAGNHHHPIVFHVVAATAKEQDEHHVEELERVWGEFNAALQVCVCVCKMTIKDY